LYLNKPEVHTERTIHAYRGIKLAFSDLSEKELFEKACNLCSICQESVTDKILYIGYATWNYLRDNEVKILMGLITHFGWDIKIGDGIVYRSLGR